VRFADLKSIFDPEGILNSTLGPTGAIRSRASSTILRILAMRAVTVLQQVEADAPTTRAA
jgi:hypothetical protein